MPVVQNIARDPSGEPVRARVLIRLVAGDPLDVNTPGYLADGTVLATAATRADETGFWSVDLIPNSEYLPTGTYYRVLEQAPGTRAGYEHLIQIPDGAGPYELVNLLVEDIPEPDDLYLLATQKGAAGGIATLDVNGQVPAEQLGNASGGGGGGTPSSTVAAGTSYGQSSTAGAATTYSRGDHSHGTPALPTAAAIGAATTAHTHSGVYDPAGTATSAVATHVAAIDPHGDRAYADTGLAGKANTSHSHAGSDITSGTVPFARLPTGTTSTTIAVGDHTHAGGGGGAVDSVNGQTGTVVLVAADVGADAAGTAASAVATHAADTTSVHGIADTANLVLTNDSRLSDSRTPTAHASSHASAGGDPITVAQSQVTGLATALAGKQDADADLTTIAAIDTSTAGVLATDGTGWIRKTYAALKTALSLVKADVGLGNVDNTSDAGKPVSIAQQSALDLKANLASPTFTGTPSLPTGTTGVTQTAGNSTTALATTAFVTAAAALKADLASPALTGNPTAPTQAQGNSSTRIATTAYVQTEVGLLVPKSLYTAKGALAVASAANTPATVTVGTDGQVLTADSAQSTGVKWATPSGGSGGTDYKSGASPKTGLWYRGNYGPVGANLTTVLNRLYAAPFRLNATTTFDRIGIDVATAAGAGGVARLAIYASDATGGLPGTLILDCGTVAIDTTGGKSITINQQLAAGMYWLAIVNQTTGTAAVRATASYDPMVPYFTGANMFVGATAAGGLASTGTSYTGALSSTPTIVDNDNCPIIGLRAV